MKSKFKDKMFWVKLIVGILWAGVLVFIFIHRKDFTIDTILNAKPNNLFLAALFMIFLFGLKSLTIFIYSGLLYLADGIMFPLWMAVIVSLIGTFVMFTIPYVLGRWLGKDSREHLLEKYPQLQKLDSFQSDNAFLSVLIARIARLPADVLSMYFGMIQIRYPMYILASVLSMVPHMITYPLMGSSINDPSSPQFLGALAAEILWTIGCIVIYRQVEKHRKTRKAS